MTSQCNGNIHKPLILWSWKLHTSTLISLRYISIYNEEPGGGGWGIRVHSKGAIFPSKSGRGSAARRAWSWKRTMRRHRRLAKIVVAVIHLFQPHTRYLGPDVSRFSWMMRSIWKTTAVRWAMPAQQWRWGWMPKTLEGDYNQISQATLKLLVVGLGIIKNDHLARNKTTWS